ncbi:MAG: flagellar hook-length control protein FliK [Gemmatimonadaceae bacterium]
MTLPIAASRVVPEFVPLAGPSGAHSAHPPLAGGAGDAQTSTEFRAALATALGVRPVESGRDGVTSARRARNGRAASESSDTKAERASRAGGEAADLRITTGGEGRASSSSLAPDVRETFIGLLQGNLDNSDNAQRSDSPEGGIVVVASGERRSGDATLTETADVGEFVASSIEVATAPLDVAAAFPGSSSVVQPGMAPVGAGGIGSPSETDARADALSATARRDPLSVRRDMTALAPEFRGRLEHIIERMESEYGYTVEVVETTRSQQRQDALFAQGRTQPGPIVTWTRSSNHGEGRAVDVIIDGSYGNAPAYARLAQVAREEGLRTLGPRDPGHVELPASISATAERAVPFRAAVPAAVILSAPIPHLMRSAVDPKAVPATAMPAAVLRTLTGSQDATRIAADRLPVSAPHASSAPQVSTVATVVVPAGTIPAGHMARVARVAQVSPVATVATVARVATVGGSQRAEGAQPAHGDAPTLAGVLTGADVPARERAVTARQSSGERQTSSDRREREQPDALLTALVSRDGGEDIRSLLSRELPRVELGDSLSAAPVAGLSHTDATERIARVLRMQESAGDRPLSSVLLRLDNPEGGEDRIRIDLRGNAVGTTLDMSDPRTAEQLRTHASELQQSLQRQGLEGEPMVFRSASRTTDSAAYSLSAGAAERDTARAASATASDGGGFTAKDSRNQPRAQQERDGTDHQRSRQRRDGKGEQK